jgi:hypothetical protein
MKKLITAAFLAAATTASLFAGPAEDALAAAKKDIDSVAKGDVKALFTGLPASYQKDVSSVVTAFANKVDAEVFTGIMDTVGAFADVGAAKSDLLAKMMDSDDAPKAADIAAAAAGIKGLAGKLTLDTLKKGDVAAILANPEFAAIAGLAKGEVSKIKLVGSKLNDDGSVTVSAKTEGDDDDGTDDTDYVKVEGVWVSKDLSGDWKETVGKVLEGIAGFEMDDEKKEQILGALPMLKMGLQGAKSAKTSEQLQQNLMMSLFPLMMMGGGSL